MATAAQQAALTGLSIGVGVFNLGLGSPGLGGMLNGLNMAQLAQLNGMNGMNPFNMNMLGMANLSAMGISPEAQLLAAQIAAAGGGFGQQGLAGLGGIGGFAGLQGGMGGGGAGRGGPGRSGGRSPGLSANGKSGLSSSAAGNNNNNKGSAKKDEEDFDPVVLNDLATWLCSLRSHKYTPNFEGMSWKEMVLMDEQALEAQGVAALDARRKMPKTFEIVRRKWVSMIRLRYRHHRPRLVHPRRRRRLPLGARLVAVVGYRRRE